MNTRTEVDSILDVLMERGLISSVHSSSDSNLTFHCPFPENHGGRARQSTPSFGIAISPERLGSWNCLSCHEAGRSIYTLYKKLTGESLDGEKLEDLGIELPTLEEELDGLLKDMEAPRNASPVCKTSYPQGGACRDYVEAKAYLTSRNIPPYLWDKYGLTFYAEKTMPAVGWGLEESNVSGRRIIIPLRWNNKVIGYSARAIDKSAKVRYYRPVSGIGETLYDPANVLQKAGGVAFITEGEISAWACDRENVPCMATYGSILHAGQAKYLTRFKLNVFLYDNDTAGREGYAKALALYGKKINMYALWFPTFTNHEGKEVSHDPASLTPGWGKKILELAQKRLGRKVDDLDKLVEGL